MRYWFDTEFIEDGKTIDLISIGIVAEDGREFYALNLDCDWSKANDWVKQNVLSKLPTKPKMLTPSITKRIDHSWWRHQYIGQEIINFVGDNPEFWAYYADYDWVVLCQLFGTMMDLPKGFPMYCRDIKQECDRLGNPQLPEQPQDQHHALADARWNRQAWEFLRSYEESPIASLSRTLQADSGYAWSWHCNLAMMAVDAGAHHREANEHAATFMNNTFGIDVRSFSEWKSLFLEGED